VPHFRSRSALQLARAEFIFGRLLEQQSPRSPVGDAVRKLAVAFGAVQQGIGIVVGHVRSLNLELRLFTRQLS
jgi:hypothetical protein